MTAPAILDVVGFNPYQKFRAQPSDYLLVAAAAIITCSLVIWAFFG